MHVLQDEEPRHQPRRQTGPARTRPAHRAEALVEEQPVDLARPPHQRMAHVDDLIERRTQQVLLRSSRGPAIVSPSCQNPAIRGSRSAQKRNPKSQENRSLIAAFLQIRLLQPADFSASINAIRFLHGRQQSPAEGSEPYLFRREPCSSPVPARGKKLPASGRTFPTQYPWYHPCQHRKRGDARLDDWAFVRVAVRHQMDQALTATGKHR